MHLPTLCRDPGIQPEQALAIFSRCSAVSKTPIEEYECHVAMQ